jgi:hypothetical protein
MNRLGLALALTIGALVLNCTTAHHGNTGGDGGMLGDAHADGTCCTVTPQTFTTIAQGDVAVTNLGEFPTAPVDVSQYRELVVDAQLTSGTCFLSGGTIGFQEPGTTLFISRQGFGRARVDGPLAQVVVRTGNTGGSCSGTAHYIIAGVSLN